jgi:hypothetical protein
VLVRDNETHLVGGLLSYRCLTWGHIFFIRVSDLEGTPRESAMSSDRA